MLWSTLSKKKKKIALQSQCLVPADEPLHIELLKVTKPDFLKREKKTLKRKCLVFISHSIQKQVKKTKQKNIHNEIMKRCWFWSRRDKKLLTLQRVETLATQQHSRLVIIYR